MSSVDTKFVKKPPCDGKNKFWCSLVQGDCVVHNSVLEEETEALKTENAQKRSGHTNLRDRGLTSLQFIQVLKCHTVPHKCTQSLCVN